MDTPARSPQLRAAIEALYGNEALTDGLDDEAAEVLLNWGVDNLDRIFTASPDSGSEETTESRQTANRRLLRRVKAWALERTREPGWLDNVALLADEAGLPPVPADRRAAFLQKDLALPPLEFIGAVRSLFIENES